MINFSDEVLASMTASAYAAAINANGREEMATQPGLICFELVEDQDFWARNGVVTGLDLARDLDASFEREMEKQRFYDDQDWEPVQADNPMQESDGWFI